jgi:hypothetical protein
MTDLSPTDTLRAAADRLTQPGAPILVAPRLVKPLATWLERVAELHEENPNRVDTRGLAQGCQWCADEDWPCADMRHALALADAILDDAPPSGPTAPQTDAHATGASSDAPTAPEPPEGHTGDPDTTLRARLEAAIDTARIWHATDGTGTWGYAEAPALVDAVLAALDQPQEHTDRPLRVYVSGPYSADPERSIQAAIQAADQLLTAGHAPLVPHLKHPWIQTTDHPYEAWLNLDLSWLQAADAVLRIPGHSPGADHETALAHQLGIPVHHTIDNLIEETGQ